MNSPVALYARVSTGRQEQEKTIESQLEALRVLAQAKSGSAVEPLVFKDEGYSGSRLDRPGLDALRDAIAEGQFRTLLIYDPDRLSRNFVHQQILLEEFQRRGVDVVFAQRPLSDRPEDRLLAQMQGAFAEYERTKIVERTRRGKLYRARIGLLLNWSEAPYGYRILPRTKGAPVVPAINESEARWVRKMYRWIAEEGLSIRKAAKRLNELGVPPRRAELWSTSNVSAILDNSAYTGVAYYNKTEATEPKRRREPMRYPRYLKSYHKLRPKEEWIPVSVPRIISPELAARAQEERAKHCWNFPRNVRHPYLLRTLVVCGECGWRMSAHRRPSRPGTRQRGGPEWYAYYACEQKRKHPVDLGRPKKCHARMIRAEVLDNTVWNGLREFLQTPDVVRAQLSAYLDDRREREAGEAVESKRLEEHLRQLERQRQRLVDAFQAGALKIEELRARGTRIETERGETERRLGELQALRERKARGEEVFHEVETFCRKLRNGLDQLTLEEKQRVVKLLVERVVVKGTAVTVEHIIPLSGRFRSDALSPQEGGGVAPIVPAASVPLKNGGVVVPTPTSGTDSCRYRTHGQRLALGSFCGHQVVKGDLVGGCYGLVRSAGALSVDDG